MTDRMMEKLNPFWKAVTILCAGLLLAFGYSVLLNVLTIAICLLLMLFFSRAKMSSLVKVLLPALLAAASLFMTGLLYSNDAGGETVRDFSLAVHMVGSVYSAVQLSTRVLAFAFLGMLFALTTRSEEFIGSLMHQCKVKPKFAYGILAAFHLMPHIGKEYQNAVLAFRTRGIHTGKLSLKPVSAALVNCIRWSENVAMAMESKGFDGDSERTFYHVTVVRWYDFVFLGAWMAFLVLGLLCFPW